MRNMLAFLAAAALTLIGVGWYLEWYKVGSGPARAGHRSVTIDINAAKIGQDLSKAEKGLQKKLAEKGQAKPEPPKKVEVPEERGVPWFEIDP